MTDKLSISCGPADNRGVRIVTATLADKSHRGKFDTDDAFRRKKFRQEVVDTFGLDASAHEFLEQEILRVADLQDENQSSIWQPDVSCMVDIEPIQVDWLWEYYIPAGSITVFDGDPGLGKTQLTIDIAARCSRGDAMPPASAPDGTYTPGNVLLSNAEDDHARVMRPRLGAAGADLKRIHILHEMHGFDGEERRLITLPGDLPALETIIVEKQISLWPVDPFVAFLDSNLSVNNDADVRRCLGQVASLAERTGVAVLLVRHLNKKSGLHAKYRGGGSIGITGAARSVFIIGEDPADGDSRILAPVKCNLAPEPPSLRFHIEPVGTTSRIRWGDSCDISAADLLRTEKSGGGGKFTQAKDIIAEILANGSRGSNEVEQACLDKGISVSTCNRARRQLGVQAERTGFDDGQWLLSMPSNNGAFRDDF